MMKEKENLKKFRYHIFASYYEDVLESVKKYKPKLYEEEFKDTQEIKCPYCNWDTSVVVFLFDEQKIRLTDNLDRDIAEKVEKGKYCCPNCLIDFIDGTTIEANYEIDLGED